MKLRGGTYRDDLARTTMTIMMMMLMVGNDNGGDVLDRLHRLQSKLYSKQPFTDNQDLEGV